MPKPRMRKIAFNFTICHATIFQGFKNLLALVKWIRGIDQGNNLNFQHPTKSI
jgi:hypothetical protein